MAGERRAGVSTLEYVAVCAMIIIVASSALFVLGNSMKGVNTLATNFQAEQPTAANSTAKSDRIDDSRALSLQSNGVSELQIFAACSAVCIIAMGVLQLQRARKKKEEPKPQVCSVQQLQQQSKALKAILSKRSSIQSILLEDWVQLFEGNAEVGTYMSRSLATVSPDMSIAAADKMLREDGFRRVMVVHEDGKMAGVLSRKDIATKKGVIVADIMTSEPKTASPEMGLRIALSILLQHRISCLPVVRDGYLVGILSTSDLLIVLQCILLILSNHNADSTGQSTNTGQMDSTTDSLSGMHLLQS
ncbi:MAG: CBS domain-containing protein [Planctomycetales bacterium]|nr:CBS domain-containing protein [Planctomycetales bacterium]